MDIPVKILKEKTKLLQTIFTPNTIKNLMYQIFLNLAY